MGYIGAVNIVIGATSGPLAKELARVKANVVSATVGMNNELSQTYKQADAIQREFAKGIGRTGKELQQAGAMGVAAFTLPVALLGMEAARSYAELERLEKAIINVDKGTDLAAITMREFVDLAKMPGLGIQEVNNFYLKMRAVKTETADAFRYIKAFGTQVARDGGGKAEFGRIGVQLAQLITKSKIEAQDLKSIMENSPGIGGVVMDLYGTVSGEEITKKLQAAGKTTRDFVNDLVVAMEKLGPVQSGFANSLENLKDGWFLFGAELGRAADEAMGLTGGLDSLGNMLTNSAVGLKDSSLASKQLVMGLVGLSATTPLVILGLGSITTFLANPFRLAWTNGIALVGQFGTSLAALANPFTLTVVGTAALVGGMYMLKQAYSTTIDETEELQNINNQATIGFEKQKQQLADLAKVATDATKPMKVREEAMRRINQLNGKYLGDLTLAEIGENKGRVAMEKYNKVLQDRIRLQVLQQRLASLPTNTEIASQDISLGEVAATVMKGGGFFQGANFMDLRAAKISRNTKTQDLIKKEMEVVQKALGDDLLEGFSSKGGGKTDAGAGAGSKVAAAKAAKDRTIKLAEQTALEIERLQVDLIQNEQQRQQEMNELNYQEAIKAKVREYEEAKKPLDEQYFVWLKAKHDVLRAENLKAEREFYKTLVGEAIGFRKLEGKSVRLDDNGPRDDKDKAVMMMQTTPLALPKIGSQAEVIAHYDKLNASMEYQWTLGERLKIAYDELGRAGDDMAQQMAESFAMMSVDVTANMATIVGEMIAGTAQIQDLTFAIFDMLAQVLAQMAKVKIATGIATLVATKGTKGWGDLAGGIGFGIGGGIASGIAKKNRDQAKQLYRQNSQEWKDKVRPTTQTQKLEVSGTSLVTVTERVDNIRRYN